MQFRTICVQSLQVPFLCVSNIKNVGNFGEDTTLRSMKVICLEVLYY